MDFPLLFEIRIISCQFTPVFDEGITVVPATLSLLPCITPPAQHHPGPSTSAIFSTVSPPIRAVFPFEFPYRPHPIRPQYEPRLPFSHPKRSLYRATFQNNPKSAVFLETGELKRSHNGVSGPDFRSGNEGEMVKSAGRRKNTPPHYTTMMIAQASKMTA